MCSDHCRESTATRLYVQTTHSKNANFLSFPLTLLNQLMIKGKRQTKSYLNGQVFFAESNESLDSWVALLPMFV